MEEPLRVFCCYSSKDRPMLVNLKKHLKVLEHDYLITVRADVDIKAGDEWEKEIQTHLETAQIILLLISSNFMASEYCYSREMKRAIERHEQGKARVIPLLLHSVDWQNTPLGKLQVLPPDAKPIAKWRPYDDGFVAITQGIRKVVEELRDREKPGITPEMSWEVVPLSSSGPGSFDFAIRPKRQIPISSDLLALLNQYKEMCQRLNTPFLTPHLLLALFEVHNGKAQRYLNLLTPPCADQVLSILRHIVDVALPTREVPFSDFQWEERQDVQHAQKLTSTYISFEVTEEHLLLAALCMESTSSTIRGLKGLLGEKSFRELVLQIQSSLSRGRYRPETPDANEWFRRY